MVTREGTHVADEKRGGQDEGVGPFELGRSYDEVGPDLGRLHEAWHARTGRPALRLYLTEQMDWRPSGRWAVRIACQPPPGDTSAAPITLQVDEAPPGVPTKELANVLVLTSAALTRVEGNARLGAHLGSGRDGGPSSSRRLRGRLPLALALLAGGTLLARPHMSQVWEHRAGGEALRDEHRLMYLGNADPLATLGYPMPDKPFRHQAVPPCVRRKVVVEINGGCWVEVAQKPPCDEDQAEHQGKCYMPKAKPPAEPRAVEP
nr:hypothetical protein [Archangium primigenium]